MFLLESNYALSTMNARKIFVNLKQRYPALLDPVQNIALSGIHKYTAVRNSPAESVLDNLAKCIVEDVCLNVPEFGGQFYMNPRSALFRRIARDGYYEPELTSLCAQHILPNTDVLDIGANIGFHSVLFASLVQQGQVLAVEPTSSALERLTRNLARNKATDKVQVHHGAVSNTAGTVDIKVIPGREEFSTLGEMSHQAVAGEEWQVEKVACDTLDALVQRYGLAPKFIKVDVEGFEHQVFSSGAHTLSTHRPIILAELSNVMLQKNGSSAAKVIEMLQSANYDISNANRPSEAPGTGDYGEIICLPR